MIDKKLSDFLPDKDASYFKEIVEIKFEKLITKQQVIDELQLVMDPEIPVNLYDLGLIYNIKIDQVNNISIEMVRNARAGAVETVEQENYIRDL